MRSSLLRRALLLCALLPLPARAEPDTFGLGDGHHGPLSLASGAHAPNVHAPLTASAPAGTTTLALPDTTGFQPGDLVLLHQTLSSQPTPAVGDTAPLSLEGSPLGRFELARIRAVEATRLLLRAPLVHTFEAPGAQALLVPEYTDVTLAPDATLEASPWEGSSGGVLALLATGTVRNDGRLSASSKGLRGGQVAEDANNTTGCTGLSEPAPRGAQRGEGPLPGRFGPEETGHGNLGHGGGGGICHNSGGGGGGHGGPGGRGAATATGDGSRPYGGLGGSALTSSPQERLLLGGGGGAGHSNNDTGTSGGRGGGIVFLRAAHLTGSGRVSANGESAGKSVNDGAGGGGAGGTLSLRVSGTLAQAALEAMGGTGGSTSFGGDGPGGGGGGGRALLQGQDTSQAPVDLRAGLAGEQPDAKAMGGIHAGAEPATQEDPDHVGASTVLPGPYTPTPEPLPEPLPESVPPIQELIVGCGCGSTSGALPGALALLGLAALRAPRRRPAVRAPRSR